MKDKSLPCEYRLDHFLPYNKLNKANKAYIDRMEARRDWQRNSPRAKAINAHAGTKRRKVKVTLPVIAF